MTVDLKEQVEIIKANNDALSALEFLRNNPNFMAEELQAVIRNSNNKELMMECAKVAPGSFTPLYE